MPRFGIEDCSGTTAQRLVNAEEQPAGGTCAIGTGLIIAVSAYGFQILAARQLTDGEYAALGQGGRCSSSHPVLSATRTRGQPGARPPASTRDRWRSARETRRLLGAILAGAVGLLSLIFARLIDELFHGETLLLLELLMALASYYLAHTARHAFRQRPFRSVRDDARARRIIRLAFCVFLFAAGVGTPHAVTWRSHRRSAPSGSPYAVNGG